MSCFVMTYTKRVHVYICAQPGQKASVGREISNIPKRAIYQRQEDELQYSKGERQLVIISLITVHN